jgi:OB-fold nucleic acid binding domain
VPCDQLAYRLGLGVGEGEVSRLGDLPLGVGDDDTRPNGKAKPLQAEAANGDHNRVTGPPSVIPISALTSYRRATVAGRVHAIEFRPVEGSSVLACVVTDTSGELTALFYGRTHIAGLRPGSNVRLRGTVSITSTGAVMINPAYELLD